jgi:hypothetical protein
MNRESVLGWLKRLLNSPLIIPVIALPVAAVALTHFATTYPPDDVNLSAEHISGVQVSTAARATITVVADHVRFAGATGQLDLVVPLPASACEQVASSVKSSCSGGGLTVMPPFSADATSSQEFVLVPLTADRVRLSIQAAENGGGVNVTIAGGGTARLCVHQKVGATGLTLHVGPNVATLPAVAVPLPDCSGPVIHVRSASPSGSSAFTFQGMKSARAMMAGKQMTVQADSLTLTLHSTSRRETFTQPVGVQSDKQVQITPLWKEPNPYFITDTALQAHATSVQEGNAEWLNTELTRDAWTSLIDSGANTLVGVVVGAAIFVVARKTGQQRSGQPEAGQP